VQNRSNFVLLFRRWQGAAFQRGGGPTGPRLRQQQPGRGRRGALGGGRRRGSWSAPEAAGHADTRAAPKDTDAVPEVSCRRSIPSLEVGTL